MKTSKRIDVSKSGGYVILHDKLGSDLTPVNAARVSYDDKSEEFTERDARLLGFLAREGHTSPFRHATLQFEVYAPLMVARQWWKYVVGSSIMEATGDTMEAWNESSRRYVKEEPTFFVPDPYEWRSAPANSKQGSGAAVDPYLGSRLSTALEETIENGMRLYDEALAAGVCAEQARLFLPAYAMNVRFYWTASLQSVAHFVSQRVAHDAQKEIQDFALAVRELAAEQFPVSMRELTGYERP